ncbi:cytoplasmic protein [Nitratireductor sp. GISD-1A_MAKvit]|uniref:cytoplasmic protein n=1 Tax=Nitratireductor sp. GISD-1A_MAKvit TaxID=3234198 RepID=UPI0034664584
MTSVKTEALAFLEAKQQRSDDARKMAALFLIGGVDMEAARKSSGADRNAIVTRLKRLLERERLKGIRRHWSYDLNRHIALAQALRQLNGTEAGATARSPKPRPRRFRRTPAAREGMRY